MLRGRCCDAVVLNVHALSDDSNDTICEELKQVFYHFVGRVTQSA